MNQCDDYLTTNRSRISSSLIAFNKEDVDVNILSTPAVASTERRNRFNKNHAAPFIHQNLWPWICLMVIAYRMIQLGEAHSCHPCNLYSYKTLPCTQRTVGFISRKSIPHSRISMKTARYPVTSSSMFSSKQYLSLSLSSIRSTSRSPFLRQSFSRLCVSVRSTDEELSSISNRVNKRSVKRRGKGRKLGPGEQFVQNSQNSTTMSSESLNPPSNTSSDEIMFDENSYEELFESIANDATQSGSMKLVDFIEQRLGLQAKPVVDIKEATIDWSKSMHAVSDTAINVNGVDVSKSFRTPPDRARGNNDSIITGPIGVMEEQPPPSVNERIGAPYNVVCTHITADFDTLASAIGLAKLWSLGIYNEERGKSDYSEEKNVVHGPLPTYVVLPRGAHPDVQRFLSLHKHLFPIRSLKSLPGFSDTDLKKINDDIGNPDEGLQRVGLVDAQRRDRLGPAVSLLSKAKLGVTVVDHHVDVESDIQQTKNYIVESVGSVSTMIAERLKNNSVILSEAEATILALGIHSDTGSLVYDSTTAKDASMLGWCMKSGASQAAIAEHAKPSLSEEQQRVLTQALMNVNSTTIYGVTISTVLLSADGFISGLASVTKDALDLSSSDVFLLAVCYEASRGARRNGGGGKFNGDNFSNEGTTDLSKEATDRLQKAKRNTVKALASSRADVEKVNPHLMSDMINSDSWKGGAVAFQRQRLAATFALHDMNQSGFLERKEISQALKESGFLMSDDNFEAMINSIDTDGDGKINFEEFVRFYTDMEDRRKSESIKSELTKIPQTMTIIGRVRAGVNVRNVNLNKLFQQFNGGGHPKAASATAKLSDESEASGVLQSLVDELIKTGLTPQLTVGDFMQSPALSAESTMTEKQVEDLFVRYDVRALPVVNSNNEVIGLVSYKEVSAAKMRLLNKQEKRFRQLQKAAELGETLPDIKRPLESALKGWMKQHVHTVEARTTMAEVEQILLDIDVGCIPVVADGTKQLIGMVTRTDLLRQHRYYSSLHYHNKGFSDSIAARKPIIELRKKLKKFDVE